MAVLLPFTAVMFFQRGRSTKINDLVSQEESRVWKNVFLEAVSCIEQLQGTYPFLTSEVLDKECKAEQRSEGQLYDQQCLKCN